MATGTRVYHLHQDGVRKVTDDVLEDLTIRDKAERAKEDDDGDGDQDENGWILANLEQAVVAKAHKQPGRSLRAALRAARCVEVMRQLAADRPQEQGV